MIVWYIDLNNWTKMLFDPIFQNKVFLTLSKRILIFFFFLHSSLQTSLHPFYLLSSFFRFLIHISSPITITLTFLYLTLTKATMTMNGKWARTMTRPKEWTRSRERKCIENKKMVKQKSLVDPTKSEKNHACFKKSTSFHFVRRIQGIKNRLIPTNGLQLNWIEIM